VYQSPAVEAGVVVGSVAVHVAAGVARQALRRARVQRAAAAKKTAKAAAAASGEKEPAPPSAVVEKAAASATSPELQLLYGQRYGGYVLTFLYCAHFMGTRGKALIAFSNSDPVDLTVIPFSAAHNPAVAVILWLLSTAGVNHALHGAYMSLRQLGVPLPVIKASGWRRVQIAVAGGAALTVAGVTGWLRPVAVPAAKAALYAQM
ncbi:hypothetical protein HK405_010321, partial [Cladochytrium tenue]